MEGLQSDKTGRSSVWSAIPTAWTEQKVPANGTVEHGMPPPPLQAETFWHYVRRHEAWKPM